MRIDSPVRRLVPLAAATLLAVALAACGSSSTPFTLGSKVPTSTSATTATTATTAAPAPEVPFSPFTAQGGVAQGLQVTRQVSGRCSSPGVAGASSYRCTSEPDAVAYDPCFAPPLATVGPLLCVADPTDMEIVRFATGALPKTATQTPKKSVWAMQLQNREVCVRIQAAWAAGRGPFACPTPSATNSLADCHAPTYTGRGWTAACQATQSASSPFGAVPVDDVWD